MHVHLGAEFTRLSSFTMYLACLSLVSTQFDLFLLFQCSYYDGFPSCLPYFQSSFNTPHSRLCGLCLLNETFRHSLLGLLFK